MAHVKFRADSVRACPRPVDPITRPSVGASGSRSPTGRSDTSRPRSTPAPVPPRSAFDLEWFDRAGSPWVRFEIHPWQRSTVDAVVAESPVLATRDVRSSSGEVEHRPVVRTNMSLAGRTVEAEVTLTRRDEMGFRMLVGREALRHRFLVDPGSSYLGGRPDKSIRRRNRGTDAPVAPHPSPEPPTTAGTSS